MKQSTAGRVQVEELAGIRRNFDPASSRRKLELVRQLRSDSEELFHEAHESLGEFEKRVNCLGENSQLKLWDTGIGGTPVHYAFSYEVASWLARNARGEISIDWEEVDGDTTRLDELLTQLLLPVETDYFDSGHVTSQEWIDTASARATGTDFDWLFAQLRSLRSLPVVPHLYDSADLPLAWSLEDSRFSKSRNVVPVRDLASRTQGLRKAPRNTKAEIQRPLASIENLPFTEGQQLINAAMAALAVRHRETFHFNHANPREVFLADVGRGISVAVFGLREESRYPLECTMGFLILSNGVPIGYGGSSIFFRQANTGVNIFDEYRGSEAAYLWLQVMRVYHHLVGCTRESVSVWR
jgi:hypothetical protein